MRAQWKGIEDIPSNNETKNPLWSLTSPEMPAIHKPSLFGGFCVSFGHEYKLHMIRQCHYQVFQQAGQNYRSFTFFVFS
jgi:hypothetical protein